jgi:hypothetical protein
MQIYPFGNTPIILNDTVFAQYGGGGYTGQFPSSQLQAYYNLAERQVSAYIGTLLLPTIITGTFGFPFPYNQPDKRNVNNSNLSRIATDYGYVSDVLAITINSQNGFLFSCDLQKDSGCFFIWEDTFGYIDVKRLSNLFTWGYNWLAPYNMQMTYQAGLPTGVATSPGILTALSIMTQINLNELNPGLVGMNEGVGDIGITDFHSLDYTEKRSPLVNTVLGNSPRANYAAKLIKNTVRLARKTLMIG